MDKARGVLCVDMSEAYNIVGYSCNNNCVHCFNSNIIGHLAALGLPLDRGTGKIMALLRSAKKKGMTSVTFTGGEPTIRKDFVGLVRFARELGLDTSVQTNGRTFSSMAFARKILLADPNISFIISFHHTQPAKHNRITQARGSWLETVAGIRNLVSAGAGRKISLKIVISRHNYSNLQKLVAFGKKLGVCSLTVSFPQTGGRALGYWRQIVPRYSLIEKHLRSALCYAEKIGLPVSIYAVPLCFLRGHEKHAAEFSYVNIWMDGGRIERNLLDRNEDILREMVLPNKRKPVSCRKCRYFSVCEGAWEEYFKLYGTGEFRPIAGRRVETVADMKWLLGGLD